jgi:hypothetical protein
VLDAAVVHGSALSVADSVRDDEDAGQKRFGVQGQ